MAVMPGAVWKPVVKSRAARRKGRGICLHVAVSEASSLQGFFSGSTSDSHFYVRKDGTIEQYVDTDLVAYANAAGNATLISVETQGGVTKADSEPWTEAQIVALTRLCAWASTTDGFPLQAMPNSLPTSRGVGYHRLGVKPWVVAGGELWSSSVGKICPGAGKIAQIPAIIAAAKAAVSPSPAVAAPATPAPIQDEDDDMPYTTFRSDPEKGTGADRGDGTIAIANFCGNPWYEVPDPAYWRLWQVRIPLRTPIELPGNEYRYFKSVALAAEMNDEAIKAAVTGVAADVAKLTASAKSD